MESFSIQFFFNIKLRSGFLIKIKNSGALMPICHGQEFAINQNVRDHGNNQYFVMIKIDYDNWLFIQS